MEQKKYSKPELLQNTDLIEYFEKCPGRNWGRD